MRLLLLTFAILFLASCADTKDCVCLRGGMPDVSNPLVIPKDLDGDSGIDPSVSFPGLG